VTPNRPQYAILNAINNPAYRFITACVSRRVGKTYIANIILQLVALVPGTTVLIISPDYSLSSISWDLQHLLLRTFDVECTRDNLKDRIIELQNGSMIRVASVSRVDSAVGRSYDLIVFDEAALNNKGGIAFNMALRPTLDKEASKCIFISTPRGDNWFKEFFDRGFSEEPEHNSWISIHADYKENPRASDKDIAEARANMSKALFEQEYLANFVTFEGQIWEISDDNIIDLTPQINKIAANPGILEVIAGLDVGFRDETAMVVIAVEPREDGLNNYFIIDEYVQHHRSTEAHAIEIKRMETDWNIEYIFCDPAAAQTRFDLAAIYDITTIGAKKSLQDGIGAVGAVIDNGRLFVHDECVEAVYALRNYRWKGDIGEDKTWNIESEKPAHDRASHMADAIRYAIYSYEQSMGGVG